MIDLASIGKAIAVVIIIGIASDAIRDSRKDGKKPLDIFVVITLAFLTAMVILS